ncbi:MAG: hypothetical protein H0X41_10460 [Chitinophagaceae bacterium]|nr:hypothetical protein [Chitinophagaceae bacterium]
MKSLALALSVLGVLAGCRKKNDINDIHAQILTFSARKGHIYNIFALDRIHTHSYNATANLQRDPWSFNINDLDILGETGMLIMDPIANSSIVINGSTANTVTFVNLGTNQTKTVELTGTKFSIDFDNAIEAGEIMNMSRQAQRDTLTALALDASGESFNVSTH